MVGATGVVPTNLVSVATNATLSGSGLILGAVVITNGANLAPGTAANLGTLTVSNVLTLAANSTNTFRLNASLGTNDAVVGLTKVNYGGTLIVTNVGAAAFTNGAYVKLFSATNYIAGPVAIQPAFPGAGLMWDVTHLAVDGTLHVVPLVVPAVSLPLLRTDGNLSFTITGSLGQPYTVRASTDATLPLASWTVLQAGTLPSASYSFSDLTATNYPARFYRVSTP